METHIDIHIHKKRRQYMLQNKNSSWSRTTLAASPDLQHVTHRAGRLADFPCLRVPPTLD